MWRKLYAVTYINPKKDIMAIFFIWIRDWVVESLSALTEDYDGNWEVEYYVPEPQANNSAFEDKKDIRFVIWDIYLLFKEMDEGTWLRL